MREWLIKLRKARKMTQKQVAEFCGISRSFYADIEHGTRNPKPDTAQDIGNVLKFDWTLFFTKSGRKTSHKSKMTA